MTCSTFAFKSTNNSWSGKLININNENPIPHDLTGYDKAYIIFKKPDGTQYPTDEQMEQGYDQGAKLGDENNPSDSSIIYSDTSLPSFLDQRGVWTFVPAALIANNLIKSPIPEIFLVV